MNPRRSRLAWVLVVAFALTVWLLPLLLVWWNAQDPRRALRRDAARASLPPQASGPLILYAETWPTRTVIDLKEVQGATAETDHALGPKAVASDLALALRELGIASEAQRLDSVPEGAALLAHREIVLIYPVRHGQPPAEVMRFIDQRLEPLVAAQEVALTRARFRDVAIAERTEQAGHAQAALAATMAYYGLGYRPGVTLVEEMNSIVIYERLRALARQLPAAAQGAAP
jgi:hypothetical protein